MTYKLVGCLVVVGVFLAPYVLIFLAGFHIDFKSDPDALNSIMNGTGIQLPDFPDKKLSSQFGRIRKNHANGRSVPFQKQKPNRLSAAPEVVSNVNVSS